MDDTNTTKDDTTTKCVFCGAHLNVATDKYATWRHERPDGKRCLRARKEELPTLLRDLGLDPTEENAPNLDAQPADRLMRVWSTFGAAPRRAASMLWSTRRRGELGVVQSLANYAINKSIAMGLREKGKVNSALIYEQICERIYRDLPPYARW